MPFWTHIGGCRGKFEDLFVNLAIIWLIIEGGSKSSTRMKFFAPKGLSSQVWMVSENVVLTPSCWLVLYPKRHTLSGSLYFSLKCANYAIFLTFHSTNQLQNVPVNGFWQKIQYKCSHIA